MIRLAKVFLKTLAVAQVIQKIIEYSASYQATKAVLCDNNKTSI